MKSIIIKIKWAYVNVDILIYESDFIIVIYCNTYKSLFIEMQLENRLSHSLCYKRWIIELEFDGWNF